MRRDFQLPDEDQAFLEHHGLPWETVTDGNAQWCLLHDWALPEGLIPRTCSVAIRIQATYLRTGLDMAYFLPAVTRADGRLIPKADVPQPILGQSWQRWSRHYKWTEGRDSLASHLLQVKQWLLEAAKAP